MQQTLTEACSKVRYESFDAAFQAKQHMNKERRSRGRDELHTVYECKKCGYWHTSRMTPSIARNVDARNPVIHDPTPDSINDRLAQLMSKNPSPLKHRSK